LVTPREISQLAYLEKNPSDAHIAATGTIMFFVGSNRQASTIIYTRGGQTFSMEGHIENFILLLGTTYITFVCFSYN